MNLSMFCETILDCEFWIEAFLSSSPKTFVCESCLNPSTSATSDKIPKINREIYLLPQIFFNNWYFPYLSIEQDFLFSYLKLFFQTSCTFLNLFFNYLTVFIHTTQLLHYFVEFFKCLCKPISQVSIKNNVISRITFCLSQILKK